jgi:hypothetical protein
MLASAHDVVAVQPLPGVWVGVCACGWITPGTFTTSALALASTTVTEHKRLASLDIRVLGQA